MKKILVLLSVLVLFSGCEGHFYTSLMYEVSYCVDGEGTAEINYISESLDMVNKNVNLPWNYHGQFSDGDVVGINAIGRSEITVEVLFYFDRKEQKRSNDLICIFKRL